MKKFRKVLSVLIVATILLGVLPAMTATVYAAETVTASGVSWEVAGDLVYIYANGIPVMFKSDGVYDVTGETRYLDITTISKSTGALVNMSGVETVYGGCSAAKTDADPTALASTKIIIGDKTNPVTIKRVIGGSVKGNISGKAETIINKYATVSGAYGGNGVSGNVGSTSVLVDGATITTLYGGSNSTNVDSQIGNIRVEVIKNSGSISTLFGGTHTGKNDPNFLDITGDIEIILNGANVGGMGGGINSKGYIGGDIYITISDSNLPGNFYGGGGSYSYVKGSVTTRVFGTTTFATLATKVVKPKSASAGRVTGDAVMYIPSTFTQAQIDKIDAAYDSGITVLYNDGSYVKGAMYPSLDTANKYAFMNGKNVTIKTNSADNKTYIYNYNGTTKLVEIPIDNYTVFGGSAVANDIASANITLESGVVNAVYGGGLNKAVLGNSFITVNGGVTQSVYGSGLNSPVGASYIKITNTDSVTDNTYKVVVTENAASSVVWVTPDFPENKITKNSNTRLFIGNREKYNSDVVIPTTITTRTIESSGAKLLFANGIHIVVKMEADGGTYIYDETGTTKLYPEDITNNEIFGGSDIGLVESTSVTLESGYIARIYGGGFTGSVTGTAKIRVTGGDIYEVIYGGSFDGDVGGTDIYVSGPYVAKGVNAGSRNGSVFGDIKVVLDNSVAKGLYAGDGGEGRLGCPTSSVYGNTSFTINGGYFESLYGGCKASDGVVTGTSTITLNGDVLAKVKIYPEGNGGVLGGTTLNIPENSINLTNERIAGYDNNTGIATEFTLNKTAAVPAEPAKDLRTQTAAVMSTEEDSGKLVYRFIDIPQLNETASTGRPGEAIFITLPNGETMLIDAGGYISGSDDINTKAKANLYAFLDQFKKDGVRKVNYVVSSHYHSDHIGFMADVLSDYNVDKLYTHKYNVPSGSAPYYAGLRTWVAANPTRVVKLERGMSFDIGAVNFKVLNPSNTLSEADVIEMNNDPATETGNNNSIVLKMTYGSNSALMAADMYIEAEKDLLAHYTTEDLKADLIKVMHHGDSTSSDIKFVRAVSPKIAVITHFTDTPIVNARYKAVGADTYVTGIDGTTKVSFDGTNTPSIVAEKYVPAIKVDGPDTVYVGIDKETVTSYTYKVFDLHGILINGFELDQISLTDDAGNTINDAAISFSNDTLTINGKPKVSYVNINYVSGITRAVKRVTFMDVPLSEYTVTINGPDELYALVSGGATGIYTATVKNSSGKEVVGIPVELKLERYLGSDATLTDGILKVTADSANNGTLKITAVFAGTTEVVATKSVAITIQEKAVPAEPHPGTGTPATPAIPPVDKTDKVAETTVEVKKSDVDAVLKDTKNTSFEVEVATAAVESTVKLGAYSMAALADKKVDLVVKTSQVALNIPASIVDVAAIAETLGTTVEKLSIEVKIKEVPQKSIVIVEGSKLKPTSKVFEFTIKASDGSKDIIIDSFGTKKVVAEIPMTEELIGKDQSRINVYRYNEETKTLELLPTKIADGKIVFTTSSFSLYAVMLNEISFADANTHWADKAIHTLAAKSILNGKAENVFDPEGKMTRAEYAAIIARALELPKSTKAVFNDVAVDAWYAGEVNTAWEAGLIGGNGDGSFAPEALITREEMAVIASRVFKYAKGTEAKANGTFADAVEISDWAVEGVNAAYANGLAKGYDNKFAPKADMTRAEGATILYNLLVKLGII